MRLRIALEEEIGVLTELSRQSFDAVAAAAGHDPEDPEGYEEESWYRMIDKSDALFVLEEGGKIIGGAVLFPNPRELFINRFFIAPEKAGDARVLLQLIEEHFPDEIMIETEVPEWDQAKVRLLEENGYLDCGTIDGDICFEKIRDESLRRMVEKREKLRLSSYDGKNVRITLENGETEEGECFFDSAAYNEAELGIWEEALSIGDTSYFVSDISRVDILSK